MCKPRLPERLSGQTVKDVNRVDNIFAFFAVRNPALAVIGGSQSELPCSCYRVVLLRHSVPLVSVQAAGGGLPMTQDCGLKRGQSG
jgi:hypothetical protein